MKLTQRIIPLLLISALAGQAHSTVLDFDGHQLDGSSPIFDSGFRFDFTARGWAIAGPLSGACCNLNYNGTPAMYTNGELSGPSRVVMTKVDGNTFALSALDAATYWTGSHGTVELIGSLVGGGTVTASLDIDSNWKSFTLPASFVGLTSLTFQDSQIGPFLGAPGFGIDNLNVTSVPEPETYAMAFSGLLMVGGSWARRRRTAA